MALIQCPECQHAVSDRAASCPKCGFAIAGAVGAMRAGLLPSGLSVPASGATTERMAWEGTPSVRLMARELPGIVWAVVAPPFLMTLFPRALKTVAAIHPDLRAVIHEQGATLRSLVFAGLIVVSLVRLGRAALRYARLKGTHYRITNQRLTIESGLVSKRVDDIDLRTVEDVGLEQSPLERLLGVGRLTIVSTDRARPRLQLYGILGAREVREQLRAGVYEASQRQIFTRAT